MVFKSFAAIARHSALAKNLFVASTASSTQPAFFVSTQQLARQQASAQTHQLIVRSVQQPFSSGAGSEGGNFPNSANGASFPSYGNTFSSSTLSVSTAASSDDENKRVSEIKSSYRANSAGQVSGIGTNINSVRGQHVRRLSTTTHLRKQITQHGENERPSSIEEEKLASESGIPTAERLVEVDDKTAAEVTAEFERRNSGGYSLSSGISNSEVRTTEYNVNSQKPADDFNNAPSQQGRLENDGSITSPYIADVPDISEIKSSEIAYAVGNGIKSNELFDTVPFDQNGNLWSTSQLAASHSTLESACHPDTSEIVIIELFNSNNYVGVIGHYELMKKNGIIPTLDSFNKILISIASGTSTTSTTPVTYLLETYARMLSYHIVPDVATYSTIILALVNRYMETRRLLATKFNPVISRFSEPNQISNEYSQLVKNLRDDISLDLALDVFFASVSVRKQNYTIEVYNALLEACAETGDAKHSPRIISVLDSMHDVVSGTSVFYNADTFIHLIRAFGRVEDISSALEVFGYYKDVYGRLGEKKEALVYSELIRAYFYCNDGSGAIAFFEKIIEKQSVLVSHEMASTISDALIDGYLLHDDYVNAWIWLQQACKEFLTRPSMISLSRLLSSAAGHNDFNMANQIFDILMTTYDYNSEWSVALMDYIDLCIKNRSQVPADYLLDIAKNIISKNIVLEMHSVGELALHLITSMPFDDNTIRVSYALVSQQIGQWEWQSQEEHMAYSQVLSSLMSRLLMLTKWSSIDEQYSILSNLLTPISKIDFTLASISGDSNPENSLLGIYLRSHWSSWSSNARFSASDLSTLVYLHSRFLVSLSESGSSQFFSELSRNLVFLLNIASESRLILSPQAGYFVSLAESLLSLSEHFNAPAPVRTESIMPEALLINHEQVLPSGMFHMPVPPHRLGEIATDIPLQLQEAPRKSKFREEEKILIEMLGYDAELSQDVLRKIYINTPAAKIVQDLEGAYSVGKSISPIAIVKIIAYCGASKDVNSAETLYSLAEKTIPPPSARPMLHFTWTSIYNAMLSMYFQCQSKNVLIHKERLVSFKEKLMDIGTAPDASTYANLIIKLKLAGSHDEATEAVALFTESQEYGVQPSTYLYNVLLSKLSKARRLKEALFYYNQMKELGLKRTSVTYGTMISACCRAGDEVMAEQLFEEMESAHDYKPRIAPFNTMLQFYVSHKKDRNRALEYFNRLRELKLIPSSHSYKLLIDAYATVEPIDVNAAEKVLDTIVMDGQQVTAQHYAALITAHGCILRNLDSARKFFEKIINAGAIRPDDCMFQALIEAYIANGQVQQTENLLELMRSTYRIQLTAYMANILVRGWATINIQRSESFFYEVLSKNMAEPSTFESMIRAYLSVDNVEGALKVLDIMRQGHYPDPVIYRVASLLSDSKVEESGDDLCILNETTGEIVGLPSSTMPPMLSNSSFKTDFTGKRPILVSSE
ncbi:hypothetical protein V1511DRAFT_496188 [Dipodascopsis uninucleata]